MKGFLVLSIFAFGLISLPHASLAQTAQSGINTNPARAQQSANAALETSQGERGRYCSDQYTKQKIPQNQKAAFMTTCMQQKPSTKGPMTPAQMAAYDTKSKNCTAAAKAKNMTGDSRTAFMQGCMGP